MFEVIPAADNAEPYLGGESPISATLTMLNEKMKLSGPPPGWQPDKSDSTAGLLANLCTNENDRILEAIYQDRKRETRREIPE